MDKETHRTIFWDDWAAKADQSKEHVRFMLGIDDLDEANMISTLDVQEVISLLPDLTGMEVLELASGVGRFTPELAKRAKHVTSTDFMELFVKENQRKNYNLHSNITFKVMDATKMNFPPNSFDCVFFVWLLAYLSDDEIKKFADNVLRILRPGGIVFFRETHFTCACSCDTTNNAGVYRSIKSILDNFNMVSLTDSSENQQYCFRHKFSVNSQTYTKLRKMPTLFNHLFIKDTSSGEPCTTDIDMKVYNEECMQVYDTVIQDGFSMPGGLEAAKKWLSSIKDFKQGAAVLDIGCGIGGLQSYLMKCYSMDTVDGSTTGRN